MKKHYWFFLILIVIAAIVAMFGGSWFDGHIANAGWTWDSVLAGVVIIA